MRRCRAILGSALLLLIEANVASAQDALDFFHTLLLRRPVIEREIESQARHEAGRGANDTVASLALDFPLLPWWQIELGVPFIARNPDDGPGVGGVGDIAVENKFRVLTSPRYLALVAVGFDVGVPTGSLHRGLGGQTTVAPFVTAAIKLGDFHLLGDLGYEWLFSSQRAASDEQRVTAGFAIGRPIQPWLTPMLEVVTVTQLEGPREDANGTRLLHRPQLYLAPGVNIDFLPGKTLLIGVEAPATHARTLDWAVRVGLVWRF